MNGSIWSVLSVRLVLPVIGFSANLLLLSHFGVERYSLLSTLLQGALLVSVLLKFGRDDALLYGRLNESFSLPHARIVVPVALILLISQFILDGTYSAVVFSVCLSLAQVVLLGYLNANLTIAAMSLQVRGQIWLGNLTLAMSAPVAAMVGYELLALWKMPSISTDSIWFSTCLGFGFSIGLALIWFATYLNARSVGNKYANQCVTPTGTISISKSLWYVQVIDVLLLSGDLILLGLFDRREGLELYIASTRLAVASAFVIMAAEQAMATLQRKNLSFGIPRWLIPVLMAAMVPLYVIFLNMIGIRAGQHYELATLVILMLATAMQSLFLRQKVQWAGAAQAAPLRKKIGNILLFTALACAALFWLGLILEFPASVRATAFGVLSVSVRWILAHYMTNATRGQS